MSRENDSNGVNEKTFGDMVNYGINKYQLSREESVDHTSWKKRDTQVGILEKKFDKENKVFPSMAS